MRSNIIIDGEKVLMTITEEIIDQERNRAGSLKGNRILEKMVTEEEVRKKREIG